ncbi:MAG: hypothetical protein AB9844_04435 [Clostridiaceae bacterium]
MQYFSEFITWGGIVITQLHFRKKIGENAKDLKYKSLLFPYANYFVLAYFALLLILMIIMPDYRMGAIALPIWIGILFVAYKMLLIR